MCSERKERREENEGDLHRTLTWLSHRILCDDEMPLSYLRRLFTTWRAVVVCTVPHYIPPPAPGMRRYCFTPYYMLFDYNATACSPTGRETAQYDHNARVQCSIDAWLPRTAEAASLAGGKNPCRGGILHPPECLSHETDPQFRHKCAGVFFSFSFFLSCPARCSPSPFPFLPHMAHSLFASALSRLPRISTRDQNNP